MEEEEFFQAIEQGTPNEILQEMLKNSKLLTTRDSFGRNGLSIACLKGHFEVVKLFIKELEVRHLNEKDLFGFTCLYYACQENHVNIVRSLLKTEGLKIQPTLDTKQDNLIPSHQHYVLFSPFQIACWNSHKKIIQLFFKYRKSELLEHEKILGKFVLECLQELHEFDHQELKDLLNLFPMNQIFFIACSSGNWKLVDLLFKFIKYNPSLNHPPAYIYTNLLRFYQNHVNTLPPNLVNPFNFAVMKKFSINFSLPNHLTSLIVACKRNHVKVVELLLQDSSINVNLPMDENKTPFYVACENGSTDIVKLLLRDERVNVNIADRNRKSPFFIACEKGYLDIVKLLCHSNFHVGFKFNESDINISLVELKMQDNDHHGEEEDSISHCIGHHDYKESLRCHKKKCNTIIQFQDHSSKKSKGRRKKRECNISKPLNEKGNQNDEQIKRKIENRINETNEMDSSFENQEHISSSSNNNSSGSINSRRSSDQEMKNKVNLEIQMEIEKNVKITIHEGIQGHIQKKIQKQIKKEIQKEVQKEIRKNKQKFEPSGIDLKKSINRGIKSFCFAFSEKIKYMFNQRIDITQSDQYDKTPFFISCEKGHLDIVMFFLFNEKIEIQRQLTGRNPFSIACEKGHIEIVKLFLTLPESSQLFQIPDPEPIQPVPKPSKKSQSSRKSSSSPSSSKVLIKKIKSSSSSTMTTTTTTTATPSPSSLPIPLPFSSLNPSPSSSSSSPVKNALLPQSKELSQNVEKHPLDLLEDNSSTSTSTSTSTTSTKPNSCKYLNHIDIFCCSPFYLACQNGRLDIVKLLIDDERIDINRRSRYSPLYIACEEGHLEIVKMLINNPRIDLESQFVFPSGFTPFSAACISGKSQVVQYLLSLDHDVITRSFNQPNHLEQSPFLLACLYGCVDVVKILLSDSRIEVNSRHPIRGTTPFHAVCDEENIQLIKLLLQHDRIDINKSDFHGITPLFSACERGSLITVKYLLCSYNGVSELNKHKLINMKLKTVEERSPLGIAREKMLQEPKFFRRKDEVEKRRAIYQSIVSLLEDFESNPNEISFLLRKALLPLGLFFFFFFFPFDF